MPERDKKSLAKRQKNKVPYDRILEYIANEVNVKWPKVLPKQRESNGYK